ncbi:hypothetical protein ABPG72_021376 [Tetrahymena utriculariae]
MGKNKKQKKQVSNEEEDQEEGMYMQLTEIKSDDSPNKKNKLNNSSHQAKKRSSSSSGNKNKKHDDDEEELDEIDMFDGQVESQNNFPNLKNMNGFIVKQQFRPCEALTGFQTRNVYDVFPADEEDEEINKQTIPIMRSLEESNCFIRNLLSGRCRPFEMSISTHKSYGDNEFQENVILILKREFKCTFFCWQRPTIEVFQVKNGINELLGRVVNPFNFCDLDVLVFDRFDKQLFSIEGSCCSCGFLFQNFGCKPCQELEFFVKDSEGNDYTQIKKKQIGCYVGCVSDTSKYFIQFPETIDNTTKTLLLAATILLDYIYFEGGSKICLNL